MRAYCYYTRASLFKCLHSFRDTQRKQKRMQWLPLGLKNERESPRCHCAQYASACFSPAIGEYMHLLSALEQLERIDKNSWRRGFFFLCMQFEVVLFILLFKQTLMRSLRKHSGHREIFYDDLYKYHLLWIATKILSFHSFLAWRETLFEEAINVDVNESFR